MYDALSRQLGGKTVEDRLNEYLEELLQLIPEEQRRQIGGELQKEQEGHDRRMEEQRQFSIFHVRENGRDDYFQNEPATYAANAAYYVRQYLRREPGWQTDSFAEGYTHRESISTDEFDRLLERHLNEPAKIVSVFDLDFDKREFSVAVPEEGWRTYAMKDVSAAAYLATEDAADFLPPLYSSALRGIVHDSENRTCRLLFKLAVEIDMMMNVLAGAAIPLWQLGCSAGLRGSLSSPNGRSRKRQRSGHV